MSWPYFGGYDTHHVVPKKYEKFISQENYNIIINDFLKQLESDKIIVRVLTKIDRHDSDYLAETIRTFEHTLFKYYESHRNNKQKFHWTEYENSAGNNIDEYPEPEETNDMNVD